MLSAKGEEKNFSLAHADFFALKLRRIKRVEGCGEWVCVCVGGVLLLM